MGHAKLLMGLTQLLIGPLKSPQGPRKTPTEPHSKFHKFDLEKYFDGLYVRHMIPIKIRALIQPPK